MSEEKKSPLVSADPESEEYRLDNLGVRESKKEEAGEYPGVDYPEGEKDVMKDRSENYKQETVEPVLNEEMLIQQRAQHDTEIRAVALEVAQHNADRDVVEVSIVDILLNAKKVEDYLRNGILPDKKL